MVYKFLSFTFGKKAQATNLCKVFMTALPSLHKLIVIYPFLPIEPLSILYLFPNAECEPDHFDLILPRLLTWYIPS